LLKNADVEKIEVDGLDAPAQGVDSSLEAAMGEAPSAAPRQMLQQPLLQ